MNKIYKDKEIIKILLLIQHNTRFYIELFWLFLNVYKTYQFIVQSIQ